MILFFMILGWNYCLERESVSGELVFGLQWNDEELKLFYGEVIEV
jgi:hypothetical protein